MKKGIAFALLAALGLGLLVRRFRRNWREM